MRRAGIALCTAMIAIAGTVVRAGDFADEAFIEFLGSFDDGEGNWLDPLELLPLDDEAAARKRRRPASDKVRKSSREEETEAESEKHDDT